MGSTTSRARKTDRPSASRPSSAAVARSAPGGSAREAARREQRAAAAIATPIGRCVNQELARYFDTLDGQPPTELHRLVMRQAEAALIATVMARCEGNQSRAASWLGISRGTLRCKLADFDTV